MIGFCSIGPKSYAVQTLLPNGDLVEFVKFKGIQLTETTRCTYDDFKKMVHTNYKMEFKVPFNLRRNMGTGELRQVDLTKYVSKEFNKRIVVDDFCTVPFGYRPSDRSFKLYPGAPVYQME